MDDSLDEQLRQLGQGTPFPVDWEEYERALVIRIMRAQVRRRRRVWYVGLGGACAGAAAMLLISFGMWRLTMPPPEQNSPVLAPVVEIGPESSPAASPPQPPAEIFDEATPYAVKMNGRSVIHMASAPATEVRPGVRKTITFKGFGNPDGGQPGIGGYARTR